MKDSLTIEPSQAGHVAQGRKEVKDEQLFARLIGAAVLLALAVIVLPFVLDGSGSQREYEYAETLPAEPARPRGIETSFSSRQTPVTGNTRSNAAPDSNITATGATTGIPQRSDVQVNVPPTTTTVDLKPTTANGAANGTAGGLTSAVASAAESDNRGSNFASSRETNPGQVNAVESVPLKPGWNIQVASFVRDANAIKLISRLRNQNLPAYANRVQGGQRTLIRVLVGPYGNQIDALAQQNDIDRDYRVESLMVRGR